ncbi:Sec63-domain-containing protein [Dipodascopsis tothii]|uniref:Sec63-domain-containing protein n=1 Tax=Dipodascopsis tothii TaxID=44089 RepID=UPI0034CE2A58
MAPALNEPPDGALSAFLQSFQRMQDGLAAVQTAPKPDDFIDVDGRQIRFDLDDDDFEHDAEDYSSDTDDDRVYSSPSDDEPVEAGGSGAYDREWLNNRTVEYISRTGNTLAPDELLRTLEETLTSRAGELDIQSRLADILGYDDFEFISDLVQHREQVRNALMMPTSDVGEPHQHSQVTVRTADRGKKARRDEFPDIDDLMQPEEPRILSKDEHRRRVQENAREARQLALPPPRLAVSETQYPHVYRAHDAGNTLSTSGNKYSLPVGTTRESEDLYEEITIPYPKKKVEHAVGGKLVEIDELDTLCQRTFKGYKTLNRVQSLVYPVAYGTNENMLICAPTGAGKTDVAMLAVLRTIAQHCTPSPLDEPAADAYAIAKGDFKIVYVAPLKALAAEIVQKLGKRLAWAGIEVRELTGDMQLTKAEIMATQIIVTTPEKWDVVTRKSNGDSELVQKVKLLIIDEVHLLHDERGAVIESLVARTLRQVESTQSMIRIVGLSATLPNFVDVAEFLKVNLMAGLFYFDASFRPIPLEQHFIGVRGKAGSKQAVENIDKVTYKKVIEMLTAGHQVMIFVHSRKDTLKTAKMLREMAMSEGDLALFDASQHDRYRAASADIQKSRNRELREILRDGLGIHHAGMLRTDRNLMERLFAEGVLKILCCTATLAWGVNLPASAVIIKGTQVYDAKKGGFTDLGITDVIQIFGRAGRPQYEKFGIAFLCTSVDRLGHYISAITQQHAIESRFVEKVVDNLNAEISLGTVTNVDEGVQWLGYTYLFVRMRKNALAYGIEWSTLASDPLLGQRRRELVVNAARTLHTNQMIVFDERTGTLVPKDLGRIASDFYLLHTSVEIFNNMMAPGQGEADVLAMLSMSGEFDGLRSRQEEATELAKLRDSYAPCQVAGTTDTSHGKINILIQAYISKANIDSFSLVSDSGYVAQNSARICRALFLIAMNRRWGHLALVLLSLCKSLEKRLWSFEHPLAQFGLPAAVVAQLDAKDSSIEALREMDAGELGEFVHNRGIGGTLARCVGNFPLLTIEAEVAPITRNVLRVHLDIVPNFTWNDRVHGRSEFFWIWVEDSVESEILHSARFILSRRQLYSPHALDFSIPLTDPLPPQIFVRAVSDRWAGAESVVAVSFQHLIRPDTESIQTKLLDLRPLPITALANPVAEQIYAPKFGYFNPMQTMIFHCMYHLPTNVLLGSPTGSGKTVAAELAIWKAFRDHPGCKVVYIAPMKALVRERVDDWGARLAPAGVRVVELTGDNAPDVRSIRAADIIITTPEKFDGISRNWQARKFVQQVALVIMDEIHLLASDRGPILEMIVSRMNYVSTQTHKPVRLLGMSTAVANAGDMAGWLGVKEGLFNFPQSVRPVPLQMYIDGFQDNTGFCPLMKSMNKPAYMAIKMHSPIKPVLIFVASRRQTRLTAMDLINFCGMEENPRRFLKMSEDELEMVLLRVKDETLKLSLQFGIALHHAGLVDSDRRISHELFANNKVQILVATSTLAWGVNLPAYLVIIKGTQFFDAKIEGYRDMDLTDILQMMGRAGRPAFDTSGVAMIFTQESKKSFYKHFINIGFPVESSLHKVLDNHLGAEISTGTVATRQDGLDFLTWTYLFRRVHKNPSYYGLQDTTPEGINSYLVGLIDTSLDELEQSGCLLIDTAGALHPTPFLKISSYYYLSHKTIRNMLERAQRYPGFEHCLRVLCEAVEYDELPVRHNEDLLNIEMSKTTRFPGELLEVVMWDPHVKAFLLLQAFLSRMDLPIADYIQDTVSVLDQCLRILQAAIDVMAELKYLKATLGFIEVIQSLKQAMWFDDHPLTGLPGLTPRPLDDPALPTMAALAGLSDKELKTLMGKLDVPPGSRAEFTKVARSVPELTIGTEQTDADTLDVTLQRARAPLSRDYRCYCPKYPKPQQEAWFLILANPSTDRIYALKRISPRPGTAWNRPMRVRMTVPEEAHGQTVELRCINDVYRTNEFKATVVLET